MQPPYRVLGPCQALRTDDGTEAVLGGARLRALLTALAAAGGRAVGTHALIDQVWGGADDAGDADVPDRTAALQALVGRLRRAAGREAVASAPGGYRLAAEPDAVDLYRFERLAAEGSAALGAGDPARAAALLDEALALWRGPALVDLPGRDVDPLVVRVEQRHAQARRDRLAAALALGRAAEVLAPLAALAAGEPLDEPLQALRIRALRAAGRPAEALAAYEEARRGLADRLGTDPGPELRALYVELLADGTAPAPEPEAHGRLGSGPGSAVPGGPSGGTGSGAAGTAAAPGGPAATGRGASAGLPARLTSFIGREDELGDLGADWGDRRLVTLTGPGGVGKTRLALEAAGSYRDGAVHLAELAAVRQESGVAPAVLGAIGARGTHGWHRSGVGAADPEDPYAEIVEHCAGRRMLLVLDNCEHLVAAAAELVHVLLGRRRDQVLAVVEELLDHVPVQQQLAGLLDRLVVEPHLRGADRTAHLAAVLTDPGEVPYDSAALGILRAGAAYVPIDARVPAERLHVLLDSAGISQVVTQPWVDDLADWPRDVARTVVRADGPDVEAGGAVEPLGPSGAESTDLAYVIFTSGSTGLPKGVMIEHGAALNTIVDVNERYRVTAADRALGLSAMHFDLSVYDVFGLLSAGGALVLPEPSAHREPARWAELVTEHGVTIWNSVPALMEMFTEHALANRLSGLPLRLVMMSGDWIPVTLPGRIRLLLEDAELWSLGGATEASIWSILHPIGEVTEDCVSIPYGKAMRNQRFHVLDAALRPCPVWVPGDLYIAGVGLARGYLNDEVKTAAAFLHHPVTGERLYRTGDLGRFLPDGSIEFLGRQDSQVKIQGYRIELGEVEAALTQCEGVRAAAVVAAGEQHGPKRLIAYVVLDEGRDDSEQRITDALRKVVPQHLVPQRILVLDELPLSDNGKVNRAALPAPDEVAVEGAGFVAPRDEVERRLAEIWAEFFGVAEIGVTASFFDLGGDSLLAVRLMARIARGLGRSLPLSSLFARPTIELLAQAVREVGSGEEGRRALVPVRTTGWRTPLVFVHPVGGDVLCYAELAELLGHDQPFYALQLPDRELASVEDMAAHYVAAVREALPEGPYRLGGWSMGGVIALEMAAQLTAAGCEVELLAVVDLIERPGPAEGAPVSDEVLLSWFARDLAGLAGVAWELPAEAFDGRPPVEVLYEEARAAGALSVDIDLDTLSSIVGRFQSNYRALLRYAPSGFAGRVLSLRAADGGASVETASRWMEYFPGDATLVDVPGDHYTVMRGERLRVLADELSRALDAH
ncbi:amino acid adenylation domain-containing protein [Streptomyces sp. adm13(2018)]|uniref:amino acid adenylation domain-containing protein n=1 Tax=Streptomyces sp. adm13(2018) TaxID=2479007 RepID=UPI0011CDD317|nr:amino acid adenylation domain-containing protein [Streptomyces sp. adm13(2018)]TXS15740.1 amino acid adenylation domain-containing protein [Streptomyces sp. adm13(2018)]